jgi:hypothetical protein
LKYLDYARLRDETWITTEVFPLFATSTNHNPSMTWLDLKTLLCALEGVPLPSLFATRCFPRFGTSFSSLHLYLQPLFINRNQQRYLNRDRELEEVRRQVEHAQGVTHRPRVNRRSVEIEK